VRCNRNWPKMGESRWIIDLWDWCNQCIKPVRWDLSTTDGTVNNVGNNAIPVAILKSIAILIAIIAILQY